MDEHIRTLRKEELLVDHEGWFDEENAERVVSWLVAAENRRPVALVGAGFTLNARDRTTGALASRKQVPLWSDLVEQLARDLGVRADRYDAPTLFEMYQEALGESKLRDSLRDTIADATLIPGEAHAALATYPCEAIVTTNCLDTQLDKACVGWRRVVVDADLSASGQRRDLIYLHGHRDFSDSWVMTRSQYEDFPRSKPVMVARVRQLLAQHPWLVVGFGMTDPNFHSITRLVGLEMRGHQPLSLALMYTPPSAAERQHWRRLGFEIATPTNKSDFASFLAWVLPKLVTTYSPTSAAARAYVRRGTSSDAKLRRFREVYSAPIVDREDAYQDWRMQLEALLTPEEQADATKAVQEAHRVAWATRTPSPRTGAGAPIPHVVPTGPAPTLKAPLFEGLDVAPHFRPLASFEEVQWLSRLLEKGAPRGSELAEHFAWGLRQNLFESASGDLPLEVLTLRLAKRSGWDSSNGGSLEALLRSAVASARKYGRERIEKLLAGEAAALGLIVPSEEDHPDLPHVGHAKAAYRAFMNVDFKDAADRYGKAARLAAEAGLDFEQWVYMVGQLDANARLASASTASEKDDERRRRQEQISVEVRRLADLPAVERWIRRADAQSRSVLREIVVRIQERDRFRIDGSSGRRYGGGGHALWRSFRDLETVHAPPSLRAQYLEPLLPLLGLTDLALVLPNVNKPREWLEELLSRSIEKIAERQSRDKQLVDHFLADQSAVSKTELIARLECLPELDAVFRKDDVQAALKWLDDLSIADTSVHTAGGFRANTRDYWSAFSAAARWAEPALVCDTAIKSIQKLGKAGHVEDAVKALYGLPWYRWRPLDGDTGKRFLEALTGLLDPAIAATPRGSLMVDYALFALFQMLDAGLQADTLTSHIATWKALLENVKKGNADRHFGESRRAAFLLEKTLAGTAHFPRRSTAELFADWFAEPDGATSTNQDQRQELWVVLAETVDTAAELVPRLRAEVERLIQDVKSIRYYRANTHLSYGPIVLLTTGMKHLVNLRTEIGSYLVRLLEVAPNFMSATSEALVREWWEERDWQELMQLLVATCGGSGAPTDDDDPGLPTRRQLAMLGLFGELADSRLREASSFAWQSLQSFALGAVNDERLLIANRAAFSVVSVAKSIDDAVEARFYAAAIRRIAEDPRVPVRSAVAHAGPDLVAHARSDAVREAARQGVSLVEQDDNAQVSSLLARAKAVLSKRVSTDGKSNNIPRQEALSDGAA